MKPLAGKRAFEAMGRSARSLNLPITHGRMIRVYWPWWAREAWARGYLLQAPRAAITAAAAKKEGV